MPQENVTLSVRPRGKPVKKLPEEVTVASAGPTANLYAAIAEQSHLSVHRLRITKGSDGSLVPNNQTTLVTTTGLRQQSQIYVKDLGPQVSWRTVFLIEYLGPLLIHPLLYMFLPSFSLSESWSHKRLVLHPGAQPTTLQTLTCAMILAHFGKRELEVLLVHRFSSATMPLFNLIKNSAHYWLLSGVNMAFWIYRFDGPVGRANYVDGRGLANPLLVSAAIVLFVIGEVGNAIDHITLMNLRSFGGSERGIPHGWGFDLVTCPNYMFEVVAWAGIFMTNWDWSTIVFVIVAVLQMAIWAKKKEARYRKEFGAKYQAKKYVMLPGLF